MKLTEETLGYDPDEPKVDINIKKYVFGFVLFLLLSFNIILIIVQA
jgi:hypothetical protein